jgi:hypothetical protein
MDYKTFSDAPEVREHAKAAICMIKGDIVGAIHFLQQAIVLGRYSVLSACRDVSFRTLWGNPRFEESMSPFLSGPKFEYPYKDSCPMSAAEKAMHSKMLESEKKTARTRGSSGRRGARRH